METITLTYKRPPDRVNHFQQQLLYVDDEVIVTAQRVKPSSPIVQNSETVLADNFAVVWFVFTGLWYDVGKVYNLGNEWTGYYCDIMKPVKRRVDATGELDCFEITDLFLDLWVNPDATYQIQDIIKQPKLLRTRFSVEVTVPEAQTNSLCYKNAMKR